MNWKTYWNTVASNQKDVLAQVQRTDVRSVEQTVAHIVNTLNILVSDRVLDVCCGNGVLTSQVAKYCKQIVGVDQSNVLIAIAKRDFSSESCAYTLGDATELSKVVDQKFDKIYLQFSFQYFDKRGQGMQVIQELLKCLSPNGSIFIGDIPNHKKKLLFYNTILKRAYLISSKIKGSNPMGKFWKKRALDKICKELKVKGLFLKQPKELPYAWYRFDYMIKS